MYVRVRPWPIFFYLFSTLAGLTIKFPLDNTSDRFHNGFLMQPIEVFDMATVTVKNIPDELYTRLKSVAVINRRSINSEIIMCIERAVMSRQINPIKILENARQLRKLTTNHPIGDEEFNQAKATGRL